MAEARSIAALEGGKGARALAVDEEGMHLSLTLTVPPPRQMLRKLVKWARSAYRAVYYSVYPLATPPAFLGVTAAVVALVLRSPSDSWLRSGPLADLVWRLSQYFPWLTLPRLGSDGNRMLRVGVLAAWTSSLSMIAAAAAQRALLRTLLADKAFLYSARTPTLWVKVWGTLVHALTRGKPLTYSFQSALPAMPVPPLKETVAKYLESARQLLEDTDPEKWAAMQKEAADFLKGPGPKLQRFLWLKSLFVPNYVTDWWEKYIYLRGRDSIAINSNYYILDSGRWKPTHIQEARAASLVYSFLRFQERLDAEALPPVMIPPVGVPLCMWQYERIFATSRIPRAEIDEIKHWDPSTIRHLAVACKGSFYKLYAYRKDGSLRSPWELEAVFAAIKEDASARLAAGHVRAAESAIPALTAENRTTWATVRERHLMDSGVNRASLSDIESSLFWVSLEDDAPEMLAWTEQGRALIHGNRDRPNIWFDKSISMVIWSNGKVGLNCEHAWADAPVMAHTMEEAMILMEGIGAGDVRITFEPEGSPRFGHIAVPPAAAVKAAAGRKRAEETPFTRLEWSLSVEAEAAIARAHDNLRAAIDNFDLCVITHDAYGKDFIKQCSVSPDAYIQMAMQLAYFRDQGHFDATYESSMTRLYLHGRTETVRPLTAEARGFVASMLDASAPAEAKLKALQTAAERHVRGYQDAMAGKGIDRHLFALLCMSIGLNVEAPFLRTAMLSAPWKLSTSQQPQQQTTKWDIKDPKYAHRISPGGGFGPVAKDGYGVSYMVSGEREIFFHISALRDARNTDPRRFKDHIFAALREMRAVMEPVVKAKRAAAKAKAEAAKAATTGGAIADKA